MPLKFTLVSDGSSDQALIYILKWVCKETFNVPVEGERFDPRLYAPPSLCLKDSIIKSLDLQPCDILFVHRDAEGENPQRRYDEISKATSCLAEYEDPPPAICVVPVRMTEAWLLFDEHAIRQAASNPNGTNQLGLPRIKSLESVPDPKRILFEAIKKASGLKGRRLRKLRVEQCRYRVAELIRDFSPIRVLTGFQRLEESINELDLM